MRSVCIGLLSGMCLMGMGSMTFALEDSTMGQQKVEHKDDAQDTMNEISIRGEEKVDQAKGEARARNRQEDIQTKSKEDINRKIDAMKEGMLGQ